MVPHRYHLLGGELHGDDAFFCRELATRNYSNCLRRERRGRSGAGVVAGALGA